MSAWAGLPIDVKGDVYEGLLQKNAEDTESGAGQYFTSRPLISAIRDHHSSSHIVSGYLWSGVVKWSERHPKGLITDRRKNILYEAQHY